jgi:hypothetical protein
MTTTSRSPGPGESRGGMQAPQRGSLGWTASELREMSCDVQTTKDWIDGRSQIGSACYLDCRLSILLPCQVVMVGVLVVGCQVPGRSCSVPAAAPTRLASGGLVTGPLAVLQ